MLRADGKLDVRLAALALWLVQQAEGSGVEGGAVGSTAHRGSSGGIGGNCSESTSWRGLLCARCAQLLSSYPTSLEEDEQLLASGQLLGGAFMEEAVLRYRASKKRVLQHWGQQQQ